MIFLAIIARAHHNGHSQYLHLSVAELSLSRQAKE